MNAFHVTVRRHGVSPLTLTMLVGAGSADDAGRPAAALAERDRGGVFEVRGVRQARDTLVVDAAC